VAARADSLPTLANIQREAILKLKSNRIISDRKWIVFYILKLTVDDFHVKTLFKRNTILAMSEK
jgi:hypothetical protein